MSGNMDLGRQGEDLAAAYLKEKGFRIRERNWRSGRNEVDIIAEKGDLMIFVEVKTRRPGSMMPPASAVDRAKQANIIRAADVYIRRYDLDVNARFDIISIETNGSETRLEHIDEAFYALLRRR
ncbi:MAG TPA: YraN family protein [Bacteroidales bacterium]|nr:YraN family protein [Bacteroidales bacterium]HRZ75874.1 YraN family protein [Bacteroidales bacterium]